MVKIFSIILLVLLIAFGGERGLQACLAMLFNILLLGVTVLAVFYGLPPLAVSAVTGLLLTVVILFYQNGNNSKTRVAFAVVLAIVAALLLLTAWLVQDGNGGGYSEIKVSLDDGLFLDGNIAVDMTQLQIAVILLGLLGAVKDAAVAITSAVYEVHRNNPDLTPSQLYRSGRRIGREILGTSINTLFFSCVGESLLLFNIILYWGYDLWYVLNSKALFQVVLFSGIACLGCVFAIPLAAFGMTLVLKLRHNQPDALEGNHPILKLIHDIHTNR